MKPGGQAARRQGGQPARRPGGQAARRPHSRAARGPAHRRVAGAWPGDDHRCHDAEVLRAGRGPSPLNSENGKRGCGKRGHANRCFLFFV